MIHPHLFLYLQESSHSRRVMGGRNIFTCSNQMEHLWLRSSTVIEVKTERLFSTEPMVASRIVERIAEQENAFANINEEEGGIRFGKL